MRLGIDRDSLIELWQLNERSELRFAVTDIAFEFLHVLRRMQDYQGNDIIGDIDTPEFPPVCKSIKR